MNTEMTTNNSGIGAVNRIQQLRTRYRRWLVTIALGSLLLSISLIVVYRMHFGGIFSDEQGKWGEFGDYVGGILNPIFGFAGFLILLWTLVEQIVQVAEQRETLSEQRAQLKEQHRAQLLRDFEATFFQLLRRFSEIVEGLRFSEKKPVVNPQRNLATSDKVETTGRSVMEKMFRAFEAGCQDSSQRDGIIPRERYGEYNKNFYNAWQHELGIYFRTLYHIFKFVDTKTEFTLDQRTRYANIARAQLSAYELSMIFYNGLWGEGLEGFRPLIERYGILKHLKAETVLRPSDLDDRTMYEETARANYKRRLAIWKGSIPEINYD